jgi:hypothetical protein
MFVQENDNNAQLSMAAPAVTCIQAGLDKDSMLGEKEKNCLQSSNPELIL